MTSTAAQPTHATQGTQNSRSSAPFAKDIQRLLAELKDDDLKLLPPDKILELRKKLNPYGRTIKGSDKYLNFSITQIHHEYWRKLIVSAVVGFLNRACDEWKVPKSIPVVKVYEYLDNPSALDTPQIILDKDPKGTAEWEFNRQWMQKRIIVKEFLEEFFQFNPDEHTKSGYIPHRADKSRAPIKSKAADLAVEHLKRVDPEFRAKEALYDEVQQLAAQTTAASTPKDAPLPLGIDVDEEDRPIAQLAVDLLTEANKKIEPFSQTSSWLEHEAQMSNAAPLSKSTTQANESTTQTNENDDPEPPKTRKEKQPFTIKSRKGDSKKFIKYKEVEVPNPEHAAWIARQNKKATSSGNNAAQSTASHAGYTFPLHEHSSYDDRIAWQLANMIPPVDTFHRLHNYLSSNYEEIRDFVRDCYADRPELELAINPYSVHDTLDDAEAFKKQHSNEVIAEVFTAHFGKWNFFDSFKEQRESTTFYNDKTILLEEIIRNTEREQRAGMELMQKTVKKEKAKNILESGPDTPGLKKWIAQNSDVARLGAERINSQNDPSIGDNQVELNIWKVAKGGQEITKHVLALQAEAPTFIKETQDAARQAGKLQLSAAQDAMDPIGAPQTSGLTTPATVQGASSSAIFPE